MRMTLATKAVLATLIGGSEKYGLQITRETGLPSGIVHPILHRWLEAGYMQRRREDVDPHTAGRPARFYWSLTEAGAAVAREKGMES